MQITAYGSLQLHRWLFEGQAAPTLPASWWLAAYSDAGAVTEVKTGGMQRIALTRGLTDWNAHAAKANTNALLEQFPLPSGSYTINSYALLDAQTNGNQWWTEDLSGALNLSGGGPGAEMTAGTLAMTWSGDITSYAADLLGGWLFENEAEPTLPSDWYVACYSDTGATTEITTGGMARQALTRGQVYWTAQESLQAKNVQAIYFPNPTADYTIRSIAILDAITGGNQWWTKQLGGDIAVTNIDDEGLSAKVDPHGLVIQV